MKIHFSKDKQNYLSVKTRIGADRGDRMIGFSYEREYFTPYHQKINHYVVLNLWKYEVYATWWKKIK